jgi:hypothetical protein
METCQRGVRPRRGTCAVGETRISCEALRSPRRFGQRGRESSGARLCARLARGSLAREQARVELRLPARRDPERHTGRENIYCRETVGRFVKKCEQGGHAFLRDPTVPRCGQADVRRPPGIPANRGSRFSGVCSGASYPLVPRLRPTESRSGPHSLRWAPDSGGNTQCHRLNDSRRTWGVAC